MCSSMLLSCASEELAVVLKITTRKMKDQYPPFNKIHHLDSSQDLKTDPMLLETINYSTS